MITKLKYAVSLALTLCAPYCGFAHDSSFDGITGGLNTLYRFSKAKSFSISPENLSGEKGKGGRAVAGTTARNAHDLGRGWEINPAIAI